MKYLLLLGLLFSSFCFSSLKISGEGNIEIFPIHMELDINNEGIVSGSYFYLKEKIPIALVGTYKNEQLLVKSADPEFNEEITATLHTFKGEIAGLTGSWLGYSHGLRNRPQTRYSLFVKGPAYPYADNKVTCEEMEKLPQLVFADLPYYVSRQFENYRCQGSLQTSDILQPLLSVASSLHNGEPIRGVGCWAGTGRIHSGRSYSMGLLMLSYFPEAYSDSIYASQTDRLSVSESYFEEWSYKSLYNRQRYALFHSLQREAKPQLVNWFMDRFDTTKKEASEYSEQVLSRISNWAASISPRNWQPEPLIEYTSQTLTGDTAHFIKALKQASNEQKLNTLRRFIIDEAPLPLVKTLIDGSSNKTKRVEESPLSLAFNNTELLSILIQKGFDVNHQNWFGKTPLFYAIQEGNDEAVEIMLEAGAKVNHSYNELRPQRKCTHAIERWGRTPLMHAAQHSDSEMIALLLKYGANPSLKDVKGSRALDYAIRDDKIKNAQFLSSTIQSRQ